MGALAGLLFGLGLFLVWRSFSPPVSVAARPGQPGEIAWPTCSLRPGSTPPLPRAWWPPAPASGSLALVIVLAVSRSPTIAFAFGVIASYAPVALVRTARDNDAPSCATCGRRPSTTWPPPSGPGCRCRRRWLSSASAGRPSCAVRSPGSARTTAPPAASTTASTGSRRAWPTRSATGSSSRCGSPARSAAATSAGCCGRCRRSCARTRGPARSSRPGRAGRSTPPGSRSPHRGSCWRCLRCAPRRSRPTTPPRGWWCSPSVAGCALVAYRVMLRIGRLPEEERVLR